MFQILFHVPFTAGLVPPNGFPVHTFGLMLLLAFVLTAMVWGPVRGAAVGLPKERVQDLAVVLFVTGFAGARVVYMIQYQNQFPDHSPLGLLLAFFQIWNGGIVLYGALLAGAAGFFLFDRTVLRRLGVSRWKLADAIAPLVCLGVAVGRLGCFLNGCCWGQAVCEECQPVPLSAALGQFPLLPAHARDQVCRPAGPDDRLPWVRGLQTSTGFAVQGRAPVGRGDPRSVVLAVEPGSAAAAAGLRPGDRVVGANGVANRIVVAASGPSAVIDRAVGLLTAAGGEAVDGGSESGDGGKAARVAFADPDSYHGGVAAVLPLRPDGLHLAAHDTLWEQVQNWQADRKGQNTLSLEVLRDGQTVPLAFTPRTVPFYPTQLYEAVSMGLLIFLLLAFQPFRRHDGQVMVVAILGYAVHRFFNEAIRIEPTYALGLTLSQWISVGIFAAGLGLEAFLRLTQPKLPAGPVPLSYGAAAKEVEGKAHP